MSRHARAAEALEGFGVVVLAPDLSQIESKPDGIDHRSGKIEKVLLG